MKIAIIGAGDIGKRTLATIFKIFPKDKELEVVLFNRSLKKAEGAYLDVSLEEEDNDFFSKTTKFYSSKFKGKPSSDPEDLKNSNVIIFTAGVSANTLGSSTREFAIPFVHKLICNYGELIKIHAPNSTILITTNPSDIATMLIQDATGFPSERVLGFGCELDARRFCKALKKELCKINIPPATIGAIVIGGHSELDMIIPQSSIIIDEMPLVDFKEKHSSQKEEIELAIKMADSFMRKEGFLIVASNGKAESGPALHLAIAARALLLGERSFMTCSQVLTSNRGYSGLTNSCVSVPVIIGTEGVFIDKDRYLLNTEELFKLENVAIKYESLFNEIKDMPESLIEKVTQALEAFERKEQERTLSAQILLKGFAAEMENVTKIKESAAKFKAVFFGMKDKEDSFSETFVFLKPETSIFFPDKDSRYALLQDMVEYFKAIEITCDIGEDQLSFSMPKNQKSLKALESLGLSTASQEKSRS